MSEFLFWVVLWRRQEGIFWQIISSWCMVSICSTCSVSPPSDDKDFGVRNEAFLLIAMCGGVGREEILCKIELKHWNIARGTIDPGCWIRSLKLSFYYTSWQNRRRKNFKLITKSSWLDWTFKVNDTIPKLDHKSLKE